MNIPTIEALLFIKTHPKLGIEQLVNQGCLTKRVGRQTIRLLKNQRLIDVDCQRHFTITTKGINYLLQRLNK